MPNLDKIRERAFHNQGSGSLVVDALKGTASMAAGAAHKLVGGKYKDTKEKVSKGLSKGLWHGFGKHVDYADRYLGGTASKVPVLGRLFKSKDKYEHALTPEIKERLLSGKGTHADHLAHTAATEGVNVRRLSAPVKSLGKVVVPVAASMYIGEKMMKHREQQKNAELNVVVQKSMLLKTAGVIRNLDQEKKAALAEVADLTKLATAQKTVFSLLKEGLIDLDQIEEKIAELVEHPDRAESFFNPPKTSGFGTLTSNQTNSSNPLEDYLLNGEK